MTRMSVCVSDAAEAEVAFRLGADVIDLRDAARGALAAVDIATAEAVVARIAGRRETHAALGEPPIEPAALAQSALSFAAAGVAVVEIAVDAGTVERCGAAFAEIARTTGLAAVMFAEDSPDFDLLPRLKAAGFAGAILDTRRKDSGRLIDRLGVARLEQFCGRCRAEGLTSGLAGPLEAPDVPRLLLVRPDVLSFRGAVRRDHDPAAALDPRRFALIRDLVPREGGDGATPASEGRDADVDCVFVRDFVVAASIGAYDFERNMLQRVAFDVEAFVRRTVARDDDLREIFSYDVILDSIRLAIGRGHVRFIETLAEEVAASTLLHPRVRDVRVNVRKLDVVDGAVGIAIHRGHMG